MLDDEYAIYLWSSNLKGDIDKLGNVHRKQPDWYHDTGSYNNADRYALRMTGTSLQHADIK